MRPAQEFNEVQRLTAGGMNDCAIARRTGIPRPTVRDWRCRPQIRPRERASSACNIDHDFSALPKTAYSYLLGLHFGDGCIARNGRVWRLRIILDKKYPAIIDRCRGAIDVLMPGQRAAVLQRARSCVEVSLYSNTGPASYPSTAPARSTQDASRWSRGSRRWSTTPRKSSSPVSSTATAVASSPTTVGSGACLITSRTDPKTSSGFTAALDALDIPLTRPDWRTIAIYRKAATARLDEFVGPKDRAVPLNCVHYTA
jgi:hypothetical protein